MAKAMICLAKGLFSYFIVFLAAVALKMTYGFEDSQNLTALSPRTRNLFTPVRLSYSDMVAYMPARHR